MERTATRSRWWDRCRVATAVTCAVLTLSCGSAASTDAGSADEADALGNGCVLRIVEDEYGFDTEVEICDAAAAAQPVVEAPDVREPDAGDGDVSTGVSEAPRPASLDAMRRWVDDEGEQIERHVFEVVTTGGCAVEAPSFVSDAIEPSDVPDDIVREQLGHFAHLADELPFVCADEAEWSESYRAVLVALADAVIVLSNRLDRMLPARPTVPASATIDDLHHIAGALYDQFSWVFDDAADPVAFQNDLWWHHTQRGLAALDGASDVEVLISGNSIMQRGFNGAVVSDAAGRPARTVALPGLTMDEQVVWTEQALLDHPNVRTVVIGVADVDLTLGRQRICETPRPRAAVRGPSAGSLPFTGRAAADVFANASAAVEAAVVSPFGPPSIDMAANAGTSTVSSRDSAPNADERFATRVTQAGYDFCEPLLTRVVDFLAGLSVRGIEPIAVVFPISSQLRDVWDAQPDPVLPRVIAALQAEGIRVLDYRTALADDQLFDDVHANADGQRELSERLGTDLRNGA